MKRSRQLALLAIAQTPWLLAGCDHQPEQVTKQGFYTSVEACERDGNSADFCQRASQSATAASANAPKYKTKAECIAEYGDLCAERQESGGFWMPLMTGFMISQMLSPGRQPIYIDSGAIYRTRTGQYAELGRDGGSGAATMRPVDATPNRAITTSRSGFGSSAAARGGWGGSSSGS